MIRRCTGPSFHKQKVSMKPNAMKMIKMKMMREKKLDIKGRSP